MWVSVLPEGCVIQYRDLITGCSWLCVCVCFLWDILGSFLHLFLLETLTRFLLSSSGMFIFFLQRRFRRM